MEKENLDAAIFTVTGFPKVVVDNLHGYCADLPYVDVVAALAAVHTNVQSDVLPWLLIPFYNTLEPTTTLNDRVMKVLERNKRVTIPVADERFRFRDRLFPTVTSIVDGVPVYVRADDTHYNGKKKRKYLSFQVFVTLDGDPLAYVGPHEGSRHDSKCFRSSPFVTHRTF